MGIALIARIIVLLQSHEFFITYKLPDDAFYYFTIAKRFVHGEGLSFDGIHPTNGYHPLWMMMLLPIYGLGLEHWDGVLGVLVLQAVLDLLIVGCLYKFLSRYISNSQSSTRYLPAFISLVYALHPIVLIRGINGLETTATALVLLIWNASFITNYLRTEKPKVIEALTFGIISGLLFLARTDMIIILLAGGLALLFKRKILGTAFYGIAAISALVVVSPWLIWNMVTFGSIMQVSADAVPFFARKKIDVLYPEATSYFFFYIKETLRNVAKPFVYTLFGLPFLTTILLLRKRVRPIVTASPVIPLLITLTGTLLLLAYHSFVRGFIRDWYIEQLIPFYLLFFGVSLFIIVRHSNGLLLRFFYSLSLIALVGLWVWELSTPRYPSQTVLYETGGRYLSQLPNGSRVAALNSGMYGYIAPSSVRVFNLDGVVNPVAFEFMKRDDLKGYLASDSIDYILEFPSDLEGYQHLIDPHLLDGFEPLDSLMQGSSHPELVLYRRSRPF